MNDKTNSHVLGVIRYFVQEERIDPTYDDLSYYCKLRPEVIARALRRMEAFGQLKVERRRSKCNHYILMEDPNVNTTH